jgi:hypothetical protein
MAEKHNLSRSVSSKSDSEAPRKWWQWFFLYPTLLIAVLGAVPTFLETYKSYKLRVPVGSSREAEQQTALWQRNFECSKNSQFQTIKTQFNVEVGSIVCESGDVLLKSRPPAKEAQYRWVSWGDIAPTKQSQVAFFSVADANADTNPYVIRVQSGAMCQRWVGNGLLLRRIRTSNGCIEEIINTYNGSVVKRYSVPCSPAC